VIRIAHAGVDLIGLGADLRQERAHLLGIGMIHLLERGGGMKCSLPSLPLSKAP